jgi:hypothetical protein
MTCKETFDDGEWNRPTNDLTFWLLDDDDDDDDNNECSGGGDGDEYCKHPTYI